MSTINIKEPSVVIREKRLGTINAFTGTASEIVEKSAKGELKDCKRKFSQCLGCNQQQAFCQLAMIRRICRFQFHIQSRTGKKKSSSRIRKILLNKHH